MTPEQCRAARAYLDWSQQRLAEAARVGNATIRNFESGQSKPQKATLAVLQLAFAAAGVVFANETGEGLGILFLKSALDTDSRPSAVQAPKKTPRRAAKAKATTSPARKRK